MQGLIYRKKEKVKNEEIWNQIPFIASQTQITTLTSINYNGMRK